MGIYKKIVGVKRLELSTPCTPCKCASQLRHTPNTFLSTFSVEIGCKGTTFYPYSQIFFHKIFHYPIYQFPTNSPYCIHCGLLIRSLAPKEAKFSTSPQSKDAKFSTSPNPSPAIWRRCNLRLLAEVPTSLQCKEAKFSTSPTPRLVI